MDGWTFDANDTSIAPAKQNTEIRKEDLEWLDDNFLPIVSPIKDVGIEFLKNVVYGVPKPCPIIFVSGTEDSMDRAQERSSVEQFQIEEEREILWIPQNHEDVRDVLEDVYPALIDDGRVKSGHREALIIGSFVAKSLGAERFGMVDGDNWSPMSIREFVTLYARGFREGGEYISLKWRCKPKCEDGGFEWRDLGRTSMLANQTLNDLIAESIDLSPRVIGSSCSGDHAVTIDLWDRINHTENHSGEVNAFVQMLEGDPPADIRQYTTMSPLFHQYGDDEHIEQEQVEVMRPIYHSALVNERKKGQIKDTVGPEVEDQNLCYPLTDETGNNFLYRLEVLNS